MFPCRMVLHPLANACRTCPTRQRTPPSGQGQLSLIFIALDFLIERKCFQAKTVELFKAVTIDQRDPREVALAFHTSAGNVYEAKRTVLAKLKSMPQGA